MSYIITLDVGTSGMKARVYDKTGKVYFESSESYSPTYKLPNLVEENPEDWENAMINVLSDVGKFVSYEKIVIEAIGITSQRASVIPVDKKGLPLRDAIMWQDKRTIDICEEMEIKLSMEDMYNISGLRVNPYFSLPRMIWIKNNEPEIYKKTYKFLGVQDYLVYKLTGNFTTDWSQASRTMLMNINELKWDKEMISKFEIDEDKLCHLIPPSSSAGKLTDKISKLTGLSTDINVLLCGGDQQNAAIALGVIEPGVAQANTGTGSFVIAHSDKPVFDKKCRVICSASAIPGKWIIEAGIFNTGSIYTWFRDNFGYSEGFNEINLEVKNSPVGANGVLLIPHFQGSAAPYWNPASKGLFFNISLGSKRSDFARAIVEGIAMEISENIDLIDNLIGNINVISVGGGMTNFQEFNIIQSNVFNKRIMKYSNAEATSFGAAVNSFVSLGIYNSVEEAFNNMMDKNPSFIEPNSLITDEYRKIMNKKNNLYNAINTKGVYKDFI